MIVHVCRPCQQVHIRVRMILHYRLHFSFDTGIPDVLIPTHEGFAIVNVSGCGHQENGMLFTLILHWNNHADRSRRVAGHLIDSGFNIADLNRHAVIGIEVSLHKRIALSCTAKT